MSRNDSLRIHQVLPESRSNGPGLRFAIWVQGCTLGCPGCFNPETHLSQAGIELNVRALLDQVKKVQHRVEGVTISGGEPLQQRKALQAFLTLLRAETSLSVVLFSGFNWSEIQRMPGIESLLACLDVLIAGQYVASERIASGLIGSANKTIHFLTSRYSLADLKAVPSAEVILSPGGEVILSGINPILLHP
jgi:anaerobic ribonucleoside-triphosphate reductase activating protein